MSDIAHTIGPLPELDLLAEVWAALLVRDRKVSPDDVFLRSLGQHGRSHRRDVVRSGVPHDRGATEPVLLLEARREGIYDGLPEALFHEAGSGRAIKRNAAEDRHAQRAREFFQPFEQELFRIRMAMVSAEVDSALDSTGGVDEMWSDLWSIPEDLDVRTRKALLLVLPHAHAGSNDLSVREACFSFVIGYPVKIALVAPRSAPIEGTAAATLGGAALGAVALGDHFHDGWPSLEVEIQGIPALKLSGREHRLKLDRAIEACMEYLLPVHLEASVRLLVREEDQELVLDDASRPGILAMNTRI
ncbi:MAG: hypothetical protein IPI41_16740 [Flavobacteriales bacterium]|nr:hypothetical protein [Flavobacteriales bacterium]